MKVSATASKFLLRVTTLYAATSVFLGVLCFCLVRQPFAQTPDGRPPSQEMVCDGLSGQAFGLCNAYCEAQDCDINPTRSCERLRENFQKVTGSPIFPCDIPPQCNELNLTDEQIDAAVTEALIGIDDPWGEIGDFQMLLYQIESKLHCTLQTSSDTASVQALQEIQPSQNETCAEDGVHYCGPGTSENGTTIHTESACLNEACCGHDTCYGVNCIDEDCYWTTQAQECDSALRAVCDDGDCQLDTEGRIICFIVRRLDDRANPPDHPECNDPASCEEGPHPDCAGQTCENFTNCNPGSGCTYPVCGTIAEGGGMCVEGMTPCDGLADCTTSADCGGDALCFVYSCCGRGVCVPASAFCPDIGANQAVQTMTLDAVEGGMTIGGWLVK